MSSITKNLGLFKYDTETDGKQVFSIDDALNNNWDKIDSGVVNLNGTQTITGAKTFTGYTTITGTGSYQSINCKNSEADYANLRANQRGARLISFDKNNQYFGYFQTFTDGGNALRGIMNVTRKLDGQIKSAGIEVQIDASGNTFGVAPTYTSNYGDNSSKIVTTQYMANHWTTTKATTTSTASKARPAVVVTNYVNGTSWYRVWSDGWIEQGGQIGAVGTDRTVTVSLLKAFTTTNYFVSNTNLSGGTGGGSDPSCNCVRTRTINNFQLSQDQSVREGIIGCIWSACGY